MVVVEGGAEIGAEAEAVVAGAIAVTGLSAFNLEISLTIKFLVRFGPAVFFQSYS